MSTDAIQSLKDRFDERFDRVSTREDMSKVLSHVSANASEIALIKKRQSQYRASFKADVERVVCLLYTSPSPRD